MNTRLVQTICLLLFLSLCCDAQGPATETPAGRQLTAWLAAYDNTNWDAYLKFLQTHFATPPGRGFQDPALRDLTGGYDLKKIELENSDQSDSAGTGARRRRLRQTYP